MRRLSRYTPGFNVLSQLKEWDEETQKLVLARISPAPIQALHRDESTLLTALCQVLLGDDRMEIILFAISQIDNKMHNQIGESQRTLNMPVFPILIRKGIPAFNHYCLSCYDKEFIILDKQTQWEFINTLILTPVTFQIAHYQVQSHDFLDKIHAEAVNAYFSHPTIWSEIGYAGPAYPRGYVRIERGVIDPWEAKSSHANN